MASEIKVNKITGKGATGGADAPLQFSDNSISKMNLSGTAPSSPVAGDMYYDTTSNTLKIYNGTAWFKVDQLGTSTDGGTEQIYEFNNTKYKFSSGPFSEMIFKIIDSICNNSSTLLRKIFGTPNMNWNNSIF